MEKSIDIEVAMADIPADQVASTSGRSGEDWRTEDDYYDDRFDSDTRKPDRFRQLLVKLRRTAKLAKLALRLLQIAVNAATSATSLIPESRILSCKTGYNTIGLRKWFR